MNDGGLIWRGTTPEDRVGFELVYGWLMTQVFMGVHTSSFWILFSLLQRRLDLAGMWPEYISSCGVSI